MVETIFTWRFWRAALERAVKTAAQTAAAVLLADEVAGILNVDWVATASVAGLAFVASVLTSVGSAGVGEPGTPSMLRSRGDVVDDG